MIMSNTNKKIAEFMGTTKLGNSWIAIEGRVYAYNAKIYPGSLRYDTDWGWLMPVVEKIFRAKPPKNTNGDVAYVRIQKHLLKADLKEVYNYVVMWIDWYNTDVKFEV